ncbi:conserved Plasmodium protein, unknown function [Plasmodium relictum]|uniref:Uncharacterized protein n=1 Tax=Plasmodium relictum TaxID=85471 RepID=A0A1J1HBW2_PLARL|nr:conserved Plasmodium protein, unknown function [Plasmodium relictum]CRH02993.1 conserved Plasmodium protein, unknown function [Plasmodium relictum]
MIKKTVNKIVNIKKKITKKYIYIYIIYLIFSIILLNYLVIYFVLNFYNKKHLGIKKDFSSIELSKILEANDEKENYDTSTYLICVVYIIFSLIFYIIEFFIKYNGKFCDYLFREKKRNIIENNVKIPVFHKKTEIFITINYVFLYLLLAVLGLIKCNIDEYFFYFFSLLIICEINTPLKVFMVFIKFIKKYYKNSYLKKENYNLEKIKKRDLYFFFCYFIILRYLESFSLKKKFSIFKDLLSKKCSENLSSKKDLHIINLQKYINERSFYKNFLNNKLSKCIKNICNFLKKCFYKFSFTFIFIKDNVSNILSFKFFHVIQYELTEKKKIFNNQTNEKKACIIKNDNIQTGNYELNHEANELRKKENDKNVNEIQKCTSQKNKNSLYKYYKKRNQINEKMIYNDNFINKKENKTIDESNYFYELSKKEYLKMKRNVNKYNKYYRYFRDHKPYNSENEYDSTSKNENFSFIKKKKREFHVVEGEKKKFFFDNLESYELDNYDTSKKYLTNKLDKECFFIKEYENKRNNCKREENEKNNSVETKINKSNKKQDNAFIYFPFFKKSSNSCLSNKYGNLYNKKDLYNKNNYLDDICMKKENNEIHNKRKKYNKVYIKSDIKGDCLNSKINQLENFTDIKDIQFKRRYKVKINNEKLIEWKNGKEEVHIFRKGRERKKIIKLSDIQNYSTKNYVNLKNFSINRKINDGHRIKNDLKKVNNKTFVRTKEANEFPHKIISYKDYNQQEKNILRANKKMKSFEKKVKIFLSNFKRKMEICILLNMVYKIISLLNILLIFFVKGIFMYINLYYFISKYKNSFFFQKALLTLIQCSFFFFFHLYVYEYKKIKSKY